MLITIWEETGYTTPLLLAFVIFIKENDDLQIGRRKTSIPAQLKGNTEVAAIVPKVTNPGSVLPGGDGA